MSVVGPFFSFYFPKRSLPTINWSYKKYFVYIQPEIFSASVPHNSVFVQKIETHQWATSFNLVTCSFITMSTRTEVYFKYPTYTDGPNTSQSKKGCFKSWIADRTLRRGSSVNLSWTVVLHPNLNLTWTHKLFFDSQTKQSYQKACKNLSNNQICL